MAAFVFAFMAAFLAVCFVGWLVAMIFAVAWSILLCIQVGGVLFVIALIWDVYTSYKGGALENYDDRKEI